jgi:hypothetical protein
MLAGLSVLNFSSKGSVGVADVFPKGRECSIRRLASREHGRGPENTGQNASLVDTLSTLPVVNFLNESLITY